MDDLFGDASLFAEFEKDREADNSFIRYDETADRSKIIFEGFDESETEESDIEWETPYEVVSKPPQPLKKKSDPPTEVGESVNKDIDEGLAQENNENNADVEVNDVKASNDDQKDEDKSSKEGQDKDNEEENVEKSENSVEDQEKKNIQAESEEQKENVSDVHTKIDEENDTKSNLNQGEDVIKDQVTSESENQQKNGELEPSKKSDKKKEKAIETLTEEDTAWLYEHLYTSEKPTKDSRQNLQKIINEKNKFHRYSKILDSTRYVPDEDSPAIQLIFNNTTFSRKYRQQIEQFIKGLLWQEYNSNNPDAVSDIDVKAGGLSCIDINETLRPELRNERMRKNHAILGSSQFHKQFLIDFLGWPFTISEPPRCNINWEIPLYGQVFDEVYADPSSVKPVKSAGKKLKPACWNCGHENCSVVKCRLPRNQARIAQNRKEFMEQSQQNKTQPKFTGASRYHLDPEIASKFNKFRPGVISDALKQAMGLKSDQLPQYIYKMRLFGYPPGWLNEAKQVESGVSIYGKDGRASTGDGDMMEDGELKDSSSMEKTEYDCNKIVEFPGFTIPTPLGIIDEHATYKMPPIQQHQLKKTLVSQSEEKVAARKRKLEKLAEEKQKEEQIKKPRLEIKEDENTENVEKDEVNSEKKEDMEVTEGTVNETNDTTNDEEKNNPASKDDASNDEIKKDGENDTTKDDASKEDNLESSITDTTSTETPKHSRPSSTMSLTKDFGTPILKRHKNALPDASKFAVGAEEHIPFENLPEATGTFDKMKSILDMIRKKNKD